MTMPVWIIHKSFSGDSSLRILFFTRDQGLVRALYKGARQPKKQAMLQFFMPLWVDFTERYDCHYVRSLEIAAPSLNLSGQNLYAALYLNELLYHALRPQDHPMQLYDAYVQALDALGLVTDMKDMERVLRRFEWTLIDAMGYGISLTEDAQTAAPIVATAYYQLKVNQGFVCAERGILGEYLLALARNDLDDPLVLKAAKYIMRQKIDHVLDGVEIKSRRLFTGLP